MGDFHDHGGHSVELSNDALTTANPYFNHLRYVLDSFELFAGQACVRARYLLPGIVYAPDADPRKVAPSPRRADLDVGSAHSQ